MASYDVQSDFSLSAEEDSDSYTDISNDDEDENPSKFQLKFILVEL